MQRRAFNVLALVFVAAWLPLASTAQTPAPSASPSASPSPSAPVSRSITMTYKGPAGWSRSTALSTGTTYFIQDGDKLHSLAFSPVPPMTASDVETYATQRIEAERKRGAEIVDEGATTICDGEPAHRWTVRSASTGVAMEMHVLATTVTGGVATATYSHKQGIGDRRDGLEAMANLCPGPFPNPVPAGWTGPKVRIPGTVQTLDSPDSTSTFITTYRVMTPDRYDAFEKDAIPTAGTVVSDKRESCGTGSVHRVTVQLGGQITEVAVSFLHGTAYKYVYTRPAAHEADTAVERALTAFCRGTGPIVPGLTPV
jgi:hypothetical protein